MSNYTKTTDFDVKDSLPSGDTGKIIRGSEFEVEFENIEVAIASKADSLNTVLTGNTSVTNLSVTGNTTLGNAASDTVTVNADFSSDLLPSADATYDLGAPGSEWQDLYVTGTANVDSLVADTVAISGGTVTATLTGNVTGNLTGTVLTAAQPNITSVGTLTSASISGDLAVDTDTLFVDVSAGNVGINTTSPASALDVNGTVTADGLTVDGTAVVEGIVRSEGTAATLQLKETDVTDQNTALINSTGDLSIRTANDAFTSFTTRFNLDHATGDISFYEDTGTTPKFFWDASAERLGIGTSSPDSKVAIKGTSTTLGEGIKVYNSAGTFANNNAFIAFSGTDSDGTFRESTASWVGCDATNMSFRYGGSSWETATEHMVIDSSGNVGIGTSSPTKELEIQLSSNTGTTLGQKGGLQFYSASNTAGNGGEITWQSGTGNTERWCAISGHIVENGAGGSRGDLVLATKTAITDTALTERMRINSSGNVGIGTSSPSQKLEVAGALKSTSNSAAFNEESIQMDWLGSSNAGRISVYKSTGAALTFRTTPSGGSSTERLRIDADGNVGIGTISPQNLLHVAGASAGALELARFRLEGATNNPMLKIEADEANATAGLDTSGSNAADMTFSVAGVERARIDTSGNLGIGTAGPTSRLHITGAATGLTLEGTTRADLFLVDSGAPTDQKRKTIRSFDGDLIFGTENDAINDFAEAMRIDSDGNVGIGTSSPLANLEISAASDTRVRIADSTNVNQRLDFDHNNGASFITAGNNTVNGVLVFRKWDGTSTTESMRIDADGNLGIGTTSPTDKLHLGGTGARRVKFNLGSGSGFVGYDGSNDDVQLASQTQIRFQTGSSFTESARIDASGNLLVGTTSSAAKITVSNAGATTTTLVSLTDAGGTGTHTQIAFSNTNGQVGTINTSGSTTSYNTSSDQRLKENIVDAPAGNIDAIKVRSFDWKADGSHQEYGFIAQELEAVAPYAVTKGETEEDMWGVDYSKLVPMLVKEIQDLKARIATLEAN